MGETLVFVVASGKHAAIIEQSMDNHDIAWSQTKSAKLVLSVTRPTAYPKASSLN